MQLKQINPLQLQALQSRIDHSSQKLRRVSPAHLRGASSSGAGHSTGLGFVGHINLVTLPCLQRMADHLFRMAVAINIRRIDEIHATIKRMVQSADRRCIIYNTPIAAKLPRPEGDLADLPAGAPEGAILQVYDFQR